MKTKVAKEFPIGAEATLSPTYTESDLQRVARVAFDTSYYDRESPTPLVADPWAVLNACRILHAVAGDNPAEQAIILEKMLVAKLAVYSIPNRYTDALSEAAGTISGQKIPLTKEELECFLPYTLGTGRGAISICTAIDPDLPLEERKWYLLAESYMADDAEMILKAINRVIPVGYELELLPDSLKGFVQVYPLYDISLTFHGLSQFRTTLAESITKSLEAEAPKLVKHKVRLLKSDNEAQSEEECIVTGIVLEPETVDATKSKEDGTEGDIYSVEAITKAMHWYMENSSNILELNHVEHGGKPLNKSEAVILECWQAREDSRIGDEDIKAGTWLTTIKAKGKQLVKDIRSNKLTGFSISAAALASTEYVSE